MVLELWGNSESGVNKIEQAINWSRNEKQPLTKTVAFCQQKWLTERLQNKKLVYGE